MILSFAAERERREPGIPKAWGPMTEAAEGGRDAHPPPSDDCFSLQPEDPARGTTSNPLRYFYFYQCLLIFPYTETHQTKRQRNDWKEEVASLRERGKKKKTSTRESVNLVTFPEANEVTKNYSYVKAKRRAAKPATEGHAAYLRARLRGGPRVLCPSRIAAAPGSSRTRS